jgi:hypothetical protein
VSLLARTNVFCGVYAKRKPPEHVWDVGVFSSITDPLLLSPTLEMPGRRCRFVSWSGVGAENAMDNMAALNTSVGRFMAVRGLQSVGEG